MKIKTKFDVNNLVKRKFDADLRNQATALEVMEVITQTCYAGTQVFYLCKLIAAQKEFVDRYSESGEFTWAIAHGVSKEENQAGWYKYREDELIEAPQQIVDIILGVY